MSLWTRRLISDTRYVRAAAILYAVLLTYLLLSPDPLWLFGWGGQQVQERLNVTLGDRVEHAIAYGILTWLLVIMRGTWNVQWCLMMAGVALAHGVGAEVAQHFIPRRSFDWWDMVADGVGIGIVCWGMFLRLPVFDWPWRLAKAEAV